MKIAVIGGGAAGLMAAAVAAEQGGGSVTLFEKNPVCGKKICITGKGRCNLTNIASVRDTEEAVVRGGKFLRTALYAFPSEALMAYFEELGVPLKTERGGRVFPVSDRAADIANALTKKCLSYENLSLVKKKVLSLSTLDQGFLIKTAESEENFDRVLIATGGKSYPGTGSDGDGYAFAQALGHCIIPPRPALIPLVAKERFCQEAMGLSLKNCALRVETLGGKKVYEDFGEMLFCHFGVSGPMVLSASSYLDFEKESQYRLILDLKPALTFEELDKRVLSDLEENRNRDMVNALNRLLPQKLIRPVLSLAELDERKKVNLLSREERLRLVKTIKALPLTITGTRPLTEAIVTRGGVALKEINPRTMESRLVSGLYFAGEVLDADALTGGFNLQIAFSTGYLAGSHITKEEL